MHDAVSPDSLKEVATAALAFTKSREVTLPSALIRYQWFDGSAEDGGWPTPYDDAWRV